MKFFKIYNTNSQKVFEILGIKLKIKLHFNNFIEKGNSVTISKKVNKSKLKLCIRGKNNKVIINDCGIAEELSISMYAENSTLEIGKDSIFRSLKIIMGVDNCNAGLLKNHKMVIGERVSIEGAYIAANCGNTELTIGDDCMFSNEITILNADSHPIYKKGTKEIVNRSYDLHIGNHCWLGKNVTILKNSILPDNTIVGCGSVVTGKFNESNCAIAGNPAKVIKNNLAWHMCGVGDYIENEIEV